MNVLKQITVEPVGFFFMFAIFAEYTTVQDLVFVKFCLNNLNKTQSDFNYCIIDVKNKTDELSLIETESTQQLLNYNTILSLSAIITSCIAGSYGDKYGRIVPLLIPSALSLITQIIFIVCSFNLNSNIFPLFFINAFLSGISGGSSSLFANAFGFISDITNDKNRTPRITALEASLFCGGFFGYSFAAFILKKFLLYRYFICFTFIFAIHSFILIYILLRLRHVNNNQSLRPVRNTFGIRNLLTLLSQAIKTVFKKRESNNRRLILLLITCFILTSFGLVVQTTLLFLYVRNRPLVWDTSLYGYFSGIKFAISGLALCFLPVIQSYCCPNIPDTIIAIIGLISRTLGLIVIGFATNTLAMFSTVILFIFSEYPLPATRSLLSKLVAIDEKGKVFACLASLQNIVSLLGGIMFPIIYKYEVKNNFYTGLSFEITAIFQMIASVIFIYIHFKLKSTELMQVLSRTNSNSSEVINILADDYCEDNRIRTNQ